MHTIADYSRLASQVERDAQAVADVREHLSEKQWETLVLMLTQEPIPDWSSLVNILGFVGIAGYPVEAIARLHSIEVPA